jgi:hypothetical protein
VAITPGTSVVTSGARTTGFTLTIGTVAVGDVLLVGVTNRDATADPSVTDNDTGGNAWAKISSQAANTNGAISVWWKRATAATSGKVLTIGGCTGSCSGVLTPYSGCLDAGNPYGTPVPEGNASGNETQAGITVGTANSWVCLFVGCTSNDTLNPTTYTCATDPATLSEQGEGISTGGSDCSMSHASAVKTTTGATGAISWAQTDGTGASIAFELIVAAVTSNASVSFTQANDTATVTATVPASAAVALTQAADTATITATVPALVSVAHTQAADTVVATVTVADAGNNAAVSFTQASDTATITATSAVAASVSFTQAADTATITATVPVLAAVSVTQAADVATVTATLAGSAAVAVTQAGDAATITATLAGSAAVSLTQAADVVSGSMIGEEPAEELNAAVAFTQADDTVSVTLQSAAAATISFAQDADTVIAAAIASAVRRGCRGAQRPWWRPRR